MNELAFFDFSTMFNNNISCFSLLSLKVLSSTINLTFNIEIGFIMARMHYKKFLTQLNCLFSI